MTGPTGRSARGGFVMLAVLFVLLALLVLCAPFLATARNADGASRDLADRAAARVALDGAARHARARLGASHPGAPDETPWSDGLAELAVTTDFDPDFLDPHDASGVMWDLDVEDVAGRIDLNSASPEVFANLIGAVTRLQSPIAGEEPLELYDPGIFAAGERFAFVDGELLQLEGGEGDGPTVRQRGVGTFQDDEGTWTTRGPRLAGQHAPGAYVVDQVAHAPVIWRLARADSGVRAFGAIEEVAEAGEFCLAGELPAAAFARMARLGSVYGGVRAGPTWQKPVRLVTPVEGGVTHEIGVDDSRWINPGATVWVRDGEVSEYRYVLYRSGDRIGLDRALDLDHDAFAAEVSVLARRPVNVNTASRDVLEALFTNLKLAGYNARITPAEARKLAELAVESRPFDGFEDFLRRLVLPAAGAAALPGDAPVVPEAFASGRSEDALIDSEDALALYLNALNANDARLEYATMPLAFTSRDVYRLELRAAINAPSGIERTRAVRERVELIAPQRDLFQLFGSQADFDEALRLTRDARGWATGPEPTSRYDGGVDPPSRAWSHVGTLSGTPWLAGFDEPIGGGAQGPAADERPLVEHVYASRTADGWAQLWATRVPETRRVQGRALHFDHETRDLEGRYLPDEPVVRPADDALVAWAAQTDFGFARPFALAMWVKPDLPGDGLLLDAAALSRQTDRFSLGREGDDLVLRLYDGFGDHPETTEREATELRFALAEGETPGLPLDTWSHVQVYGTGTRPSQTGMLVNGLAHGVRRLGMTRLSQAASLGGSSLVVESTEGFPARGPVRIGNEVVECEVASSRELRVVHQSTGPGAGFGGRFARVRYDSEGTPLELGATATDHPAGTEVEVYGYTARLRSGLPAGGSTLPSELGLFRVGRVVGLDGQLDPILAGVSQGGNAFQFGVGYEALNTSGLVLASADDPSEDVAQVMSAFSRTGGYAAIVQTRWGVGGDLRSGTPPNAPLGGVEVIRYSGWTGDTLHVAARGDAVASELTRYGMQAPEGLIGGVRVFVLDWESSTFRGVEIQTLLDWACYVVPISLPVPGATDLDFLVPEGDGSEFAQITRTDAVEQTEWVRYNSIQSNFGQLVRDGNDALTALYETVTLSSGPRSDPDGRETDGSGGGGPGGGATKGGGSQGGGFGGGPNAPASAPPSTSASAAAPPVEGSLWGPLLGDGKRMDDYPLSRAVWSRIQFRGVLGTFPTEQPAGTLVLPVFRVVDGGPQAGRPGAFDAVFAVAGDPTHLGWPLTVHRGHLPSPTYPVFAWTAAPGDTAPSGSSAVGAGAQNLIELGSMYVGLRERCPELIAPGSLIGDQITDSRAIARLVKWPSGERARRLQQVAVGGSASTSGSGEGVDGVPAMLVDEVVFDTPDSFFGATGAFPPSSSEGAGPVLVSPAAQEADFFEVSERELQAQGLPLFVTGDTIQNLPVPTLAQVGEEIVCIDETTGAALGVALRIPPGGRGLLGTRPQPHQIGESIVPLPQFVVGTLGASIGPGDSELPLALGFDAFPRRGLVLIDEELLQFTRTSSGALSMPRGSVDPGAHDGQGDGVLRGRYGTTAAPHAAGTPVILFPQRYADLWTERTDVPELSYFGFSCEQPGAWWIDHFWDAEAAPHGQCQIGVLQRSFRDVPWDADPDVTEGLGLSTTGRVADEGMPLGVQSDAVEWRVFVQYDPGAFDLRTGLAHGWKETPRLRRLGVSFTAPDRVLRSVDR